AAGGENLNPGAFEFATPPDNSNGLTPASDWIYSRRRVRGAFSLLPGFNFNAFSGSLPTQERWGGYTAFEPNLTGDRLRLFGDFLIDNENIAELFTVGVKGDKLFNGSWGYDGAFRYSQIENISEIQDVSVSRFNRLLNAADSIFNPTMADFIGTTIPYNPFGDYRVPIPSNQPLIDFAIIHAQDLNTSTLATLTLNIDTT